MRVLVDAFEAAVASGPLAGAVFVGEVAGAAPERYALIFPSSPDRVQSRATGPQSGEVHSFTVHSVGQDPTQTMWVAERVHAGLHELIAGAEWGRVLVAGYGRVRHTGGESMRKDSSVAPGVHFLVDEYEISN